MFDLKARLPGLGRRKRYRFVDSVVAVQGREVHLVSDLDVGLAVRLDLKQIPLEHSSSKCL